MKSWSLTECFPGGFRYGSTQSAQPRRLAFNAAKFAALMGRACRTCFESPTRAPLPAHRSFRQIAVPRMKLGCRGPLARQVSGTS
jgi:hypothetical protein